MFYNCLNLIIIVKNFSKNLNAIMIKCSDVNMFKDISKDMKDL